MVDSSGFLGRLLLNLTLSVLSAIDKERGPNCRFGLYESGRDPPPLFGQKTKFCIFFNASLIMFKSKRKFKLNKYKKNTNKSLNLDIKIQYKK